MNPMQCTNSKGRQQGMDEGIKIQSDYSPLTLLVSAARFPESSNEGFCCNSKW